MGATAEPDVDPWPRIGDGSVDGAVPTYDGSTADSMGGEDAATGDWPTIGGEPTIGGGHEERSCVSN